MPPPSQSVAPQGYMPSQLYEVNTPFGSREELRAMTAALREQGLQPMADIVVNHRCADQQDEHGTWNIFTYGPLAACASVWLVARCGRLARAWGGGYVAVRRCCCVCAPLGLGGWRLHVRRWSSWACWQGVSLQQE